jgi:hypothetical protein
MPYIELKKRVQLDRIIELMKNLNIKADGDLNYILFKLCKETVQPGYNQYKNFIAELNECSNEIRRRFLAPYEDTKIRENGDV